MPKEAIKVFATLKGWKRERLEYIAFASKSQITCKLPTRRLLAQLLGIEQAKVFQILSYNFSNPGQKRDTIKYETKRQ